MSNESMLSLSGNLSPEVQNKLQKLAGKRSTIKSEAPKVNNTNAKGSHSNTNKLHKPKLDQEELEKNTKLLNYIHNKKSRLSHSTTSISLILATYTRIVLAKHLNRLLSVLIR